MPTFRFETIQFGKTKIVEEELSSADLASPRALEMAHAALVAEDPAGAAQSGSIIKVYDAAGYLVATVNFSDLVRDTSGPRSSSSKAPIEEPGVMRSG
ncbi:MULTISPECIES: hypothetical protein [unclassified Mesorhizobium]|uniref:hypothetical protein n=1 Tax=unclassified Mesorhizobium TaxID=325217 RepID=UPI000FC996FD|nr:MULTISPECIES: hypothetical protein [unclassified Mesorhizobium]RVC64422.1 hypothetical protein EN779_01845 [Mesorhizobium sp. M4B.F.Ca.ET.088.02.2.1]RUW78600.1 hypothetical protein EOA31_00865 [Mesorhizobium sp. M4B.F.Ca.ET.049.02.1.2]RWF33964.1 MAG: hypothetical protein EOS45_00085 [Mesorhizobium sp.]RWF43448.1 MAG: hypothetical protein EOS65_05550 [Mesorhizobium sp.]TGV22811.1 hypothetical protein EN786_27195 [Mesorhizobium sp. M4B.F.Ca.ET.143.01.1.1]